MTPGADARSSSPDARTVLVIGAAGMLGRAWAALLKAQQISCHTLDYPDFDLTRADADRTLAGMVERHGIDTLVNCAAWTDVDAAEEHEAAAARINAAGVGRLAAFCQQRRVTLVHYSTDYVFPGHAREPYAPDAPLEPINAYGRTKADGERAIRETAGLDYRLIRTSWLYAPWGKNFVRTMAGLTAERDRLAVVDDQRGRPTSAEHLAAASLALVRRGAAGTYHVTDGGECSWFELARFIGQQVNPDCRVEPCTSEQFPRPAVRPAYSVLDLTASEAILGPMPDWQANVKSVLKRFEERGA